VIFDQGAFRKKYEKWGDFPYLIIEELDLKHFKIIGNIYENSELLKEKI